MDATALRSQGTGWPRVIVAMTLLATSMGAAAGNALDDSSTLWRHGQVSRHFWAPAGANTEIGGCPLAVGLAVGVRTPLRAIVGARVTPALVLQTSRRTNLTLLPAEGGGAMLVWQYRR